MHGTVGIAGTARLPQSLCEHPIGLEGEQHENEGAAQAQEGHRHRQEQHLLDGLPDRILNLMVKKMKKVHS